MVPNVSGPDTVLAAWLPILEPSTSAMRRYITNTKVKLVLVIASNTTNFKDDDLIAVRLIHA